MEALKEVFLSYSLMGNQLTTAPTHAGLEGSRFYTLCHEAKLVGHDLTYTDVDLIFTKVSKLAKTINFTQFREALQLVAQKKGRTYEDIAHAVEGVKGPTANAATWEYNTHRGADGIPPYTALGTARLVATTGRVSPARK